MTEIWKICEDFPRWEISTLGNLRWIKDSKPVYTRKEKRGYTVAQITIHGKIKTVKVHRLVAKAFLENPENKRCVNHKDSCKTNNKVNNLEWCTHVENNRHARENGLTPTLRGSQHGMAKIGEELVHLICQDLVNGSTYLEIMEKFGVTRNQAMKITYRLTWKHITDQYKY